MSEEISKLQSENLDLKKKLYSAYRHATYGWGATAGLTFVSTSFTDIKLTPFTILPLIPSLINLKKALDINKEIQDETFVKALKDVRIPIPDPN